MWGTNRHVLLLSSKARGGGADFFPRAVLLPTPIDSDFDSALGEGISEPDDDFTLVEGSSEPDSALYSDSTLGEGKFRRT